MKVRVSIILGMILSFWSGVVYATTFTVTNNLNEGAGSLRWAIEQSNAEEGNSKIVFDLAAPSDTITLTELITVSSSVELDGTIAGGRVTIQGPEIETLIHCVGVPTGGNFSLTSVNFGKWKSRTATGNNIAVMLDQIKEGGSANFSMNDVSVSGNAKSTTFVNAIDTAWFVSVDKCEIESVNAGVYYGNRAVITNSVFRNCHSTVTSSASRENILVEGCEFYGGNRTTISARYAEVLNCTFDGSAYGVYVMRPHCNVHVDACLFLRTQLHAIYSFNTSEDWHIEVENCEFYDNKRWICFMKRGYSEDFIPAPSRVLFHHNYCGITKEGEPRPNGGGVWAQIDYVDIHDNIFATDGSFYMIRDEGNDTLYVRNNYFGTNAKGVKIGGARAIYSTYIDDQVKEYMAPGRQEYKYYEDNVFYGIEDFGFKTDSIKSYVTLSRNLFIDMPDTAIIDVQKKQIPVISSAEVVEDKLIVTGVSGANSVVEIFRSSQAEQSALEYLTAVESDAEGAFTATIPIEKFGENPICLSATATYADRATSALSKVYCCEDCLLRLDRTEYYVKTSRQGKGDGSSWENAMDGKDFAFVLPQVGDGVTFYVAEGTYKPVYDCKRNKPADMKQATFFVQSNVTINGGYPDTAKTGDVANYELYKTVFSGDIEGNTIVSIVGNDYEGFALSFDKTDDDVNIIFSLAQSSDDVNASFVPITSPIKNNGKDKFFRINGIAMDGGVEGIRSYNPSINVYIGNSSMSNLSQLCYMSEDPLKLSMSNTSVYRCGGALSYYGMDSLLVNDVMMKESYGFDFRSYDNQSVVSFDGFEYIGNFRQNRMELGGQSKVFISNSNMENNTQGCFYVSKGDVFVKNSLFKENNCFGFGLFEVFGGYAYMEKCEFVGNRDDGGVLLYLHGRDLSDFDEDKVSIKNCLFKSNECGNLLNLPCNYESKDEIVGCVFEDNIVKTSVLLDAYGSLEILNTTFSNNNIGALVNNSKHLKLNNSKIKNNNINTCGFISEDLSVFNCSVGNNEVKGYLFYAIDKAFFKNDTIGNNNDSIFVVFDNELHVDSCEVRNNEGQLILGIVSDSVIVNVTNSLFINNKTKKSESLVVLSDLIRIPAQKGEVKFERDIFDGNFSYGMLITAEQPSLFEMNNCFISNNVSEVELIHSYPNETYIHNTTISNNQASYLCHFNLANVVLANNTLVANKCSTLYRGYYCKSNFLNNTIIGNETETLFKRFDNPLAKGNIVYGNVFESFEDDASSKATESFAEFPNLFTTLGAIDETSQMVLTLFEGTYNSETNLFTPVLAYNGGFTPTVALKSDKLPDGKSIRFPLSETTVTTDQRGVARLEQTCMGAYELECTADTTRTTDTIVVGEKFLDKVYAIGRHDSIFETIALPNGCDSVVMHTLIVKPDPKVLNYYVKTERWGTGDGSTWENAMNGDDFIFMLPQVGDGVTFHVAEGRYVKEGNALSNKINSSVKIIGGYEAEAKTGAVSDPKKYHTVFESLPEKYGYGFSNLCFYELTNTESVVELSNLDLSHSGVKGKAGKLVVDSCSFYDCYLTLDISVDTLIVSSSYFGKILEEARLYNGINHIRQQGKFASISACTFEGNSSSSLGIRMIDISASGAAHIENCTFANLYNRSTGYQITLASSNDTAFFVNNTVVGNIHQSSFSFTNVAFIGNIIAGSSSSLKDGKILKSEYNLVGEGSSLSNSDKDVNSSDLVEILNGTYDASTGLFTPVLADNGGFTPTVALKSDRLPDGTSIRFPLSETIVATDQRGVERFPLTCMGAYELAYDTSDCEIGTIIFKEDFGGNYRRDPDFGPALPDGLTTLEYGDNLVPYNGYSLRKEALKRNITNCSDFSNVNKHIYCGWYADFDDHTSEGDFDRGYFMQIDMDRNKTIFYTITINDLCEHTHLNLMMWVHPVNSKADSELILSVEDLSGNVLASEAFVVESSVNEWSKISIPFTVPLNQTSIVYKIYSEADSYGGDIAIDDIEVRLCKPAVSVNAPEDYLCATSDYKLTATYGNKGGYIEPVNYTWFKNSELSYEIEGWTKVSEGKELQLENISSNAYYRCVISSAGVEGVFDKCNSASDIIPVLLGGLNDTSFVADTILTGEIYNGNQYFEVGTFDGIVETIHRNGTCDSVVLHELHVVREDFCSLATLSSNPITKSSDYLQFTSSYPRDLKFTIMDKEGNIVCKTVERTYGAGEHKVSLFKLFGIDKRDFDPLTPYILVVSSGNDLFMTYIYISWM